jgi:spore germination cell wall hydrolase CwlJ-like protein
MVALRAAYPRPIGPDTQCLAKTVYLEAANQTLWGQLAVAQVIVNRMKSSTYPKSACAVVEQPRQFADQDAAPDDQSGKSWKAAVAIARIAQDGRVAQVVPGALFFHAAYVSPGWSQSRERLAQIGDHIFYR